MIGATLGGFVNDGWPRQARLARPAPVHIDGGPDQSVSDGRQNAKRASAPSHLRPTSRETGDGLRERCWLGVKRDPNSVGRAARTAGEQWPGDDGDTAGERAVAEFERVSAREAYPEIRAARRPGPFCSWHRREQRRLERIERAAQLLVSPGAS